MKTLFAAAFIALTIGSAQAASFYSSPTPSPFPSYGGPDYATPPVGYLPTLPGYHPSQHLGPEGVTYCQSIGPETYCYR